MPGEHDKVDVLISVPTEMEAGIIIGALEREGIAARSVGDFTSGFRAEAPGQVQVLVKEADVERARRILEEAKKRGDWNP